MLPIQFLPHNHLNHLNLNLPPPNWTLSGFQPLGVYLLYSVASIRRAVTWCHQWWATSGTAEADGVESHWATTVLPYTCACATVALPPQCLHIPVPRTAQPASRNTSNICQPLGQGLTCLLQVGYLYSSIYLSCLSMFVGGFSNQLTPNFFLHQGLMI